MQEIINQDDNINIMIIMIMIIIMGDNNNDNKRLLAIRIQNGQTFKGS